jgi:uncharacterized cofD-like protein
VSRQHLTKWLYFGLHIKRWLALLVVAVTVMGLGFAYLLRELYVSYTFPESAYWITLQFIPQWLRGLLFLTTAGSLAVFAGWRLNRSLASALLPISQSGEGDIFERVYQRRTQERGPRIVAIGGGTGLSTLLRGLKRYTTNLTAIVTVADDGGSSGRLRRDWQVIPPGDLRNCIAALADAEPLVTDLFQYRFDERAGEGIAGHSFGNLFITAMADVTGNMEEAIAATSRVLAVRGRIVPASLEDVTLGAHLRNGETVRGESIIASRGSQPDTVFIEPPDVRAHPQAVRALLEADLVVIGPGSLFTSILPNLLVQQIGRALIDSSAHTVLISNVATQAGETDGYDAADHLAAIQRHLNEPGLVDVVLANSNLPADPLPEEWQSAPVAAPGDANYFGARLALADVVDPERRYRHDSERLASAVMRLYYERDLRVTAEAAASR